MDLAFLPVLVLGAFIHGVLGFGFPMFSTPALILLYPLPVVVLLTLLPTLSINIASIAGEKHWREAFVRYWPIPVFTIIGSIAGTQIMFGLDPKPLRLILAVVMMIYLVADKLPAATVERRVPRWLMALFGASLGLMGGLTNTMAPAIVVYALYTRMNPLLVVAAFNFTFLISKSGQVAGFLANQQLDWNIVGLSAWGLPVILLSLWAGMRLRRRMDTAAYLAALRYTLWLIAIVLIADGIIAFDWLPANRS